MSSSDIALSGAIFTRNTSHKLLLDLRSPSDARGWTLAEAKFGKPLTWTLSTSSYQSFSLLVNIVIFWRVIPLRKNILTLLIMILTVECEIY